MQIRDEIIIREGRRPGLEITIPDEGDDILVLRLKGKLTPTVAEILGCGYLYDASGNPHEGFKDTNLDTTLPDMDLRLIGGDNREINNFFPELIFSLRIYRVGDTGLGIQFKAKTTGRLQEILDFFRANRGDGFTISIKSRQGDLFDGGTRVALSEGTTGAGPDPMSDVVGTALEGIANATELDATKPPGEEAPEAVNAPPLAPRPRRKRGRVHGEAAPETPPAEEDSAPWEDAPPEEG